MIKQLFSVLLAGFLLVTSCVEETNPEFDQKSFTKIYDNNLFTTNYFPIDMVQTPDGGYLILGGRRLAESNFTGIYLMKADKDGNFVKEIEVDDSYVNPIAQLAFINDTYNFFCMDPLTLQVQRVQTDANLEGVNISAVGGDLYYPCASRVDGNNYVLLTYDHLTKQSVIAVVTASGAVSQSKAFTIGAGDKVEEPIINHFIRTGRQYPFEAGRIPGGLYYFNGFYNYTFSLVFTDLNQNDPRGVVQGIQDDGGFSALLPLSITKFAGARFNFGDNYLLPNVILNPTGTSSSVDLGGNTLPELEPNAKVKIIRATINTKNVLVYGSNTRSKQIGLYFYDEATGTFLTSKYLGFSNPFEIAQVITTEDGGLAVCGTTYIAGRFPRICLIKIDASDLTGIQ
ncbi:MAG TPA: hypothetical protein PLV21_11375 [Cyclobacteriaceae bacterium]|nr:hypothetical protein [Cyclobacteriaceae bacterium]HRJ82481.1 hypothetical protein [Cyclobacteriaceae bacterium]